MAKFCEKCGAPLKEGAKFCTSCGAKLGEIDKAATEQKPEQTQTVQEPTQTYQSASATPAYSQPKKSKKLLFGIIGAIIAVVVIILLVLLVLQPGGIGGDEGKFVGTWEADVGFGTYTYTYVFNSDKSLELGVDMGGIGSGTSTVGTWKVENGKLVLTVDLIGSDLDAGSYDYSFSNNDNTLTLKQGNVPYITLTKK